MNSRPLILIFVCLILHGRPFAFVAMAGEATRTVRLDGKKLYIPEVGLTKRIIPVISFLYIGSWETKGKANVNLKPLCTLDSQNNSVLFESPEKLLKNAQMQVVNSDNLNSFLDGITWGMRQATHYAFKVVSNKRQPAVMELYTDSDTVVFNNGKMAGRLSADKAIGSGGRAYLPVMLVPGSNIINIKQYSIGEPKIQVSLCLDHTHDLQAAWQTHGGLLKSLVNMTKERSNVPELDWNPSLGNISISMEVRNVSTDSIVLQRGHVSMGKLFSDDAQMLAPGIYKAIYRTQNDSASELFVVGNPDELFAELREKLSKYNPDSESKLDIEVQLRRARILLSKKNYDISDIKWQEKITYTLSCLAAIERRLKEGATNVAKDQPGLHVRGFASGSDGSTQFYRLFIPANYNPGTPLPLLVMAPVRIASRERPFIEGTVMENHRQALLWAKPAEKHGVALLWPGYRSFPDGYSYESVNINEAIQAVEKDYNIDRRRISVYGTCGAGYTAGRLITEYNNRFAAIVYDRAIFDLSMDTIQSSPSLMEWYATVNPCRHVVDNRNIKVFVMHDNTKPSGHGPMEFTTAFLAQAKASRGDVVSYLAKQPMSQASRMDMVFDWLAACRNENPDEKRSNFLAKAGYTGPIMEIFGTPFLVVEGTHAEGGELENIQNVAKSLRKNYAKYFHGSQCAIKKDSEVTENDIDAYSLILVGNPQSNSVWAELQPKLPVKMTTTAVMYGNDRLTGLQPFQAISRHPTANDKYILMIGAADLRTLGQVTTDQLFTAWYDCYLCNPDKIISKLDSLHDTQKNR